MDDYDRALELASNVLREWFSSFRIIATTSDPANEASCKFSCGGGSYYEQVGAVREWLLTQDEFVRERARGQQREQ